MGLAVLALAVIFVATLLFTLAAGAFYGLRAILRGRLLRMASASARRRPFGAPVVLIMPIVASLMPVLIWVAAYLALSAMYRRWRESQLPTTMICRIDTDCPSGYVCVKGRCVPQY